MRAAPDGYNCAMSAHMSDKIAHRWPVRVYYEDTDAAGVVYYANYLRYCERARTEWLRSLGFDQRELMASSRLAFVVTRVEADYLRGAELDDALTVLSTIKSMGRASMTFQQAVLRGEEILLSANVVVACVNWDQKRPIRLPDNLRIQLESFA